MAATAFFIYICYDIFANANKADNLVAHNNTGNEIEEINSIENKELN